MTSASPAPDSQPQTDRLRSHSSLNPAVHEQAEPLDVASLVAHELRQPVQAIRSFVSILLNERVGQLNAVQRDFLDTTERSVRRLERLISDVQVVLVGEHDFTVRRELVDLEAQLCECLREVSPVAEQREIELLIAYQPAESMMVWADPDRLDQILLNLLENACHYAARGSTVKIILKRNAYRVLCLVSNAVDEIDISPDVWATPYVRGQASHMHHRRGMGLGLSVVERLVKAHQGWMIRRFAAEHVTIGFMLPLRPAALSDADDVKH
jgi:signal transduction histidine kinase